MSDDLNYNKNQLEHKFSENFSDPTFPKLAEIYFSEQDFDRARQVCEIGLKYLSENLIRDINDFMINNNQDHINKTYASLILAEKEKSTQNYEVELNNLIKGHQYFIKKKEKASFQEFNYFTNLLPQFIKKIESIRA